MPYKPTTLSVVAFLLPTISQAFAGWGPLPRSAVGTRLAATVDHQTTAATATSENIKTVDVLSLDSIRSSLIRQEETIIFALIERAQFRQNLRVYEKGGFGDMGDPVGSIPSSDDKALLSFMDFFMIGTELLHSGVRRYTSPEEHPFFPERLPMETMECLPTLLYPDELLSSRGGANELNFNKLLLDTYISSIVPSIAKKGDDEQHGSTVLSDIHVLQALSRRVHFGKFVAESKYRSDPAEYQRLVDAGDAEGVMKLLTNEAVEEQVIRRARLKAATYGTEPLLASMPLIDASDTAAFVAQAAASAVAAALEFVEGSRKENNLQHKIDPGVIESIYKDIIIPMTKQIEVSYLFRRCGREPPTEDCHSYNVRP
jgi:chorismate mutase